MKDSKTDALLTTAFARLDALALGGAVGVVVGVGLWVTTAWLLIKGGESVGPNLVLLSQYFPGYRVTWTGAWIGLGYGFVTGFIAGWVVAQTRNLAMRLFLWSARLRATAAAARNFFDQV